jgi:hypothetical protein
MKNSRIIKIEYHFYSRKVRWRNIAGKRRNQLQFSVRKHRHSHLTTDIDLITLQPSESESGQRSRNGKIALKSGET